MGVRIKRVSVEQGSTVFIYLTGRNRGLSGLKNYLAGDHDRQPAVRYFEP